MYKLFCLLWDWAKQVPRPLFPSFMCAIHQLHKLSRAELGLKCLAQEEFDPFKCYLNINNSNKLLAADCWYPQAAALPCWVILSPWLPEAAPWGPILGQARWCSLLLVREHRQELTCWGRKVMGSSLLPKDWNCSKLGMWWLWGSVATNTLQRHFGVAIIPGRWVSPCSLVPPMPKPWGRWDHSNRKTGSLECVMRCVAFSFGVI